MKKKILSIILLTCLLSVFIGCGTSITDNSSAGAEQNSSGNETESSITEPEVADIRLTKEIIMDYIDENKSDLWYYEEDKYTDDLALAVSMEKIGDEIDFIYSSPSNCWYVSFCPYIYWDDEANSLIFDPCVLYTNIWLFSELNMYDEIQIATDDEHMKIIIDAVDVNSDVDVCQSFGYAYMAETDIDDMRQLLRMLDNNPSVRLNPVNAEETIEFYLTDVMITELKESLTLYMELQEIIH